MFFKKEKISKGTAACDLTYMMQQSEQHSSISIVGPCAAHPMDLMRCSNPMDRASCRRASGRDGSRSTCMSGRGPLDLGSLLSAAAVDVEVQCVAEERRGELLSFEVVEAGARKLTLRERLRVGKDAALEERVQRINSISEAIFADISEDSLNLLVLAGDTVGVMARPHHYWCWRLASVHSRLGGVSVLVLRWFRVHGVYRVTSVSSGSNKF